MDIKIIRDYKSSPNSFEEHAQERCQKYFDNYPFMQSIQVFLRGDKHPTKKVKLQVRLKGKDIFASAEGSHHHDAFDNALAKLKKQLSKYKTFRYNAA